MKMKNRMITLGLLALLIATTGAVQAAEFEIDASHSAVTFQVKHLTISKVNGSFTDVAGKFTFTEGDPASWSSEATIQIASVNTGNEKRDDHLRNEDFFDAAQFPLMTFKSTRVEMEDGSEGKMYGELTMHGVTQSVVLDLEYNGSVTDPWGNDRAGFSATGKIKRKDWGLTYNSALESGGMVIGDEVKISLEVEGIKAK